MKIIKEFEKCIDQMEKISKIFISIGFLLTGMTYLAALILLLTKNYAFSALSDDLCYLGKEILGATVVPTLLFELLFTYLGLKTPSEKK